MVNAFDSFSYGLVRYRPLFAYIVVCKRIHQRFFLDVGGKKFGNVPFGTIVDSHITSSIYDDFYLLSHRLLLLFVIIFINFSVGDNFATAGPTRYVNLVNTTPLTKMQLEDFTSDLCYIYPCYFGPLSMPV
jgi:eukaryotic translation initiation factor 2C